MATRGAIRPGSNSLTKAITWYPRTADYLHNLGSKRYWDTKFTWFVWLSILAGIVMLTLPGAFVAISLFSLIGCSWIALVSISYVMYFKTSSFRWYAIEAYKAYSKLTQGWAEHGFVFYKQIWNHDCHLSGSTRDICSYCSPRLQEIRSLLSSQQQAKESSNKPIDEQNFEASEQFRAAVARQFEPSPVMKEISDRTAGS